MGRQGISLIVVTNAPLRAEDRDKLAGMTHLVVERPNIGYDFGGYREGVMQVMERKYAPRALYVMNDSMWFPLSETSDVIERARAAPEDVWGLFVDLDSAYRRKIDSGKEHVQSYFFRFSEKLLRDPVFWSYWKNMSLVSDKRAVIKLREVKLAAYFASKGYSVGGHNNWLEVANYLLTLDDEEKMDAILRHRCEVHEDDRAVIAPLLERMTALEARDKLREDIAETKLFLFSTALHPYVMTDLGFPFLKKQRFAVMVAKRAKIVEMGLHRNFPEPMQAEIEEWDRDVTEVWPLRR
nr:rhamnan synthesis F family protein [Falsirhodobacter halotolerans]